GMERAGWPRRPGWLLEPLQRSRPKAHPSSRLLRANLVSRGRRLGEPGSPSRRGPRASPTPPGERGVRPGPPRQEQPHEHELSAWREGPGGRPRTPPHPTPKGPPATNPRKEVED